MAPLIPRRFLALLLLALCVAVQPRPSAADFDHAGLARATLERHIRPAYDRLARFAATLRDRVAGWCAAPPGGDRKALDEAFREAVLAWSFIEHIRFGPVAEDHRYNRIAFWPDPKGVGRRQVERVLRKGDPSVLAAEKLQGKSVALQGLTALEDILYGLGKDRFAQPGAGRDFQCGYGQAIAENLVDITKAIKAGWDDPGGFSRLLLDPAPTNPAHRTPKDVTQEIAKALHGGIEWVRDIKIAATIGLEEEGRAPKPAAFSRSRLSTDAIIASVEGLRDLFVAGGFAERIEAHSKGMAAAILNDIDLALKNLRAVGKPVAEAVDDPAAMDRLVDTGFPLKNARRQSLSMLSQAAGITAGFNASDGD